MEAVCRSTSVLYPPFLVEMNKGIAKAREAGHNVHIFETFRHPARQDALYAQGRTVSGRIVTQARAWDSWHQYGVAADIALKRDDKWHWDFSPSLISHFFKDFHLTWGGERDGPHYQWKKLPDIAKAKKIVEQFGVLSFWLSLD